MKNNYTKINNSTNGISFLLKKWHLLLVLLLLNFGTSFGQCTAFFMYWGTGPAPAVVNFFDSSSVTSGTITSWMWDFGDGQIGTTPSPVHTYSVAGVYTVCESITTSLGCSDTFCSAITITPGTPGVTIYYFGDTIGGTYCTAPQTINFGVSGGTSGYTLSDSVRIDVSFGDGTDTTYYSLLNNSYFGGNLVHQYLNSGTYLSQIIVTGPDSAADTLAANPIIIGNSCGPLSGTIYLDNNGDCIYNSGDTILAGYAVSLLTGGGTIAWAITDSNGVYSFNVPSGPTYTVHVPTSNNWYIGNYSPICPVSGNISVTVLPSFGNDFYMGCPSGFDLTGSVTGWRFVPGRYATICVFAYDQLCGAPNGQIRLVIDPLLTVAPDTGSTYTISGDTVIFNYSASDPYWTYCIQAFTATTAVIGDTVCITMLLEPVAGDANPLNNTATYCYAVRASWDPNDKSASPEGDGVNHAILPGTQLTYTIRFQNTGTADAQDVYILDTLDQNLDINSYDVIASSHAMIPSILQGNILRFTFNNINLPDSNTNEPASHGYVTYRISPVAGVADGSVLLNTAGIYFDFNPAVITNTTMHTIDYTLSVQPLASRSDIMRVYPNPADKDVLISIQDADSYTLKVTDALGKIILSKQYNSKMVHLDVSSWPHGIYILQAESSNKVQQLKLVVGH